MISFDCDCDCIVSVIGHVPMNNCDRENHASTSRNGDVNDLMSNDRRRRHLEQVPVPKDFIMMISKTEIIQTFTTALRLTVSSTRLPARLRAATA